MKTPKLYFYDTGLAASLLGLRSFQEVALSSFRGPLFENLIIADLYKQYYNLGFEPSLYFWRDQNGRIEVDVLIDMGTRLIPVEIKSGETIVSDFFDSLNKWNEIAQKDASNSIVIYGGESQQKRSVGSVFPWKKAGAIIALFEE